MKKFGSRNKHVIALVKGGNCPTFPLLDGLIFSTVETSSIAKIPTGGVEVVSAVGALSHSLVLREWVGGGKSGMDKCWIIVWIIVSV
jgi:hypothetical protein